MDNQNQIVTENSQNIWNMNKITLDNLKCQETTFYLK